jgi:hypothetical protein
LKAVVGLGRAWIGGHFLFAFQPITAAIARWIPNYELSEEVFLVAGFGPLRAPLLVLLTALTGLAAAAAVIQALRLRVSSLTAPPFVVAASAAPPLTTRESGQAARSARWLAILLGIYVAVYGLFNTLYLPESIEVWIAVTPAAALALAALLRPAYRRPQVRWALGLAVAGLLAINLWGSVLPQTDRSRDYWYQFNAGLIAVAQRGDLVVSGAGYISDGYVAFYSGARVLDALGAGRAVESRFARYVELYRPARILVSSTVQTPPRQVVGKTVFEAVPAQSFFQRLQPQLRLVYSDRWQTIYAIP